MSSSVTQKHHNLVGKVIADGRLELVSVLGLGAYGVVYLARDLAHYLHRQGAYGYGSAKHVSHPNASLLSGYGSAVSGFYAVKCLNKVGLDARQRAFQRRETLLHTMASGHENVVTLHRVIDNPDDPHAYVILDYCPDGDLFSMITERQRYMVPPEPYVRDPAYTDGRPLPEDPAYTQARLQADAVIKNVFGQIIDSIEHCHKLGIYHRDIKPENVLCLQGGAKVVLADFGLATGDKWSSDFGCGSSFYMGPECQGGVTTRLERYNTAANDVWSLGVILINFVCGRNPWKQATPSDESFREYLRNPDFLKTILPISEETNALLKRVFALRPEARCTVSELRRMVQTIPRFAVSNMELWQRQRAAAHAEKQALSEARQPSSHSAHDLSGSERLSMRTDNTPSDTVRSPVDTVSNAPVFTIAGEAFASEYDSMPSKAADVGYQDANELGSAPFAFLPDTEFDKYVDVAAAPPRDEASLSQPPAADASPADNAATPHTNGQAGEIHELISGYSAQHLDDAMQAAPQSPASSPCTSSTASDQTYKVMMPEALIEIATPSAARGATQPTASPLDLRPSQTSGGCSSGSSTQMSHADWEFSPGPSPSQSIYGCSPYSSASQSGLVSLGSSSIPPSNARTMGIPEEKGKGLMRFSADELPEAQGNVFSG